MKAFYVRAVIFAFLFIASSCSILKREDPEKEIFDFIGNFEKSLTEPDDIILSQFNTLQSREAILKAIHILQNKNINGIHCIPHFSQAKITHENDSIWAEITVDLQVDTVGLYLHEQTYFTLGLKKGKEKIIITKFYGEVFYNKFVSILYDLQDALIDNELDEHYAIYYEAVNRLQQTYDTVIWATQYQDANYYYVVNGSWRNNFENVGKYQMGLVDQQGKVIIPVTFDQIGTIGFEWQGMVEVKKGDAFGYYNLKGENTIPVDYDWIMPYEKESVLALVKKDSLRGWLNMNYQFEPNFPSEEAKQYLLTFNFFPDNLNLNGRSYSLCEIPNDKNVRNGILFPPSYLTSNGILPKVISQFVTQIEYPRANVENISANHTFFSSVFEKINVVFKTIKTHYLDGREAFYNENEVIFLHENGDILAQTPISDGSFEIKRIDSTLIEIKITYSYSNDFYDDSDSTELDIPNYVYYRLDRNQSVVAVNSNRVFKFTEIVKIDSSYIQGPFNFYNGKKGRLDQRPFLSITSLRKMRNEILASYDYIFPEEELTNSYKQDFDWYHPQYEHLSDIEDKLSEVDRHNLAFLERILGPIKQKLSS